MPANPRENYRRVEVWFPPHLVAALDAEAGARGRNAAILAAVAARYGLEYEPIRLGRPPRPKPVPKPKKAGKNIPENSR